MAEIILKQRFRLGAIILIVNGLFALYTAGFGMLSAMDQRGIHWLLMSVSLFLMYEPKKELSKVQQTISETVTFLFIMMASISGVYLLIVWEQRVLTVGTNTIFDLLMAITMIVVVLEAARRSAGKVLMLITLAFLAYALLGPYFPEPFDHRGQSIERLSTFLYLGSEGIFGVPMGISATFIIIFVLFGSFLEKLGGGKWFIDMSFSLTGRFRGGPAKTAIFASALMGMLSGSPVANAATTGNFTIPLMRKIGFKGYQAGAIEAVSSTGGMITPPIMGAAAFIMADYLGMPYQQIALAAIIPAVLFYVSLLLRIDSIAYKRKMWGLPKDQLPPIKETLLKRGHLAIPILFLLVMIAMGRSPINSAFWSIVIGVLISLLSKETRPSFRVLTHSLRAGSQNVMTIAAACAAAGIIVGVISITGLGVTISSVLLSFSQGNVGIALVIVMLITIILGFGMPPTAVYVVLVSILIPPLVQLGIPPIVAHMFIFYYSTLAALTPPVAITAFTAAALARADANQTSIEAFKLGLLAYIIPFMFVFSPALLLQGSASEIVVSSITSLIGVCCWVASIEGYLVRRWSWLNRGIFLLAAILLMFGGVTLGALAIGLIGLAFVIDKKNDRKENSIEV
ncbi:TRAP transporter permease [Shouchella miscanthi]|uniref:TRAP transporter permease n=1 Tax=Shouchella miscanthi TaxID=2598861 RepID=A0ABU6NJH3_9BACI|nr:TRAP transporter permease [Shouchella miscanthi]